MILGLPRGRIDLRGCICLSVVILGAGYAGLAAFLEVARRLNLQASPVTVVNYEPFHRYKTELPGLIGGYRQESELNLPLDEVVVSPARLIIDEVKEILPAQSRVRVSRGFLGYDCLIVALGGLPEYYGLRGVAEYGVAVNDFEGARELCFRLSKLERGSGRASVVVVGGGLTGVEVAGELADRYGDRFALTLVERSSRILSGLDQVIGEAASRVLTEKGVKVRTGVTVAGAEHDRLNVEDGDPINCDLLIWAGGVRGHHLIGQAGLTVDRQGRGIADEYLRAAGFPRILLAGDCGAVPDFRRGNSVLPTAQAAEQTGKQAGINAVLITQGQEPQVFDPNIRGVFASIGRDAGVGLAGDVEFYGTAALLVKRMIDAHHVFQAGGMRRLLGRLVSVLWA